VTFACRALKWSRSTEPSADQAIGSLCKPLYRNGCQLTTLTHKRPQPLLGSINAGRVQLPLSPKPPLCRFSARGLSSALQNATPEKGDLSFNELGRKHVGAAKSERDASLSDLPARHISRPTWDRSCRFCPDMFAALRRLPGKR
jgi:hypothetical protein